LKGHNAVLFTVTPSRITHHQFYLLITEDNFHWVPRAS